MSHRLGTKKTYFLISPENIYDKHTLHGGVEVAVAWRQWQMLSDSHNYWLYFEGREQDEQGEQRNMNLLARGRKIYGRI